MRRKREAKEKEIKRGRRREVMQDWGRLGHAKTAKIRRNLTGLVASESRYGPPRASNPSKAKSAYTNAFIIRRSERKKKGKKKVCILPLKCPREIPLTQSICNVKTTITSRKYLTGGRACAGQAGPRSHMSGEMWLSHHVLLRLCHSPAVLAQPFHTVDLKVP